MTTLSDIVKHQREALNIPDDHYCNPRFTLVKTKEHALVNLGVEMNCRATSFSYGMGRAIGGLLGYDVDNIGTKISYNDNQHLSQDQFQASLDFKIEAERLHLNGDSKGALDHISWAMSLNKLDATWLHFDRGVYHASAGDVDNAIYDFSTEIKINPKESFPRLRSYYERGKLYEEIGEDKKAKRDYKRAARSDDEHLSQVSKKAVTHYKIIDIFESHKYSNDVRMALNDLADQPDTYITEVESQKLVNNQPKFHMH